VPTRVRVARSRLALRGRCSAHAAVTHHARVRERDLAVAGLRAQHERLCERRDSFGETPRQRKVRHVRQLRARLVALAHERQHHHHAEPGDLHRDGDADNKGGARRDALRSGSAKQLLHCLGRAALRQLLHAAARHAVNSARERACETRSIFGE